jgi:hypothetical protein
VTRGLPLVTALALGLFAPAAPAQMSKESPGRIGPAATTSVCLGTPTTPACAAETLLACLTRSDTALCRAVGAATPPRSAVDPLQTEYVIERVSIIQPDDVTDDLRDVEWFKPGYALVEALRRACSATNPDCQDELWDDLQVYLRQRLGATPAAWEVVYWRSDSEPDMSPELPDDFVKPPPAP